MKFLNRVDSKKGGALGMFLFVVLGWLDYVTGVQVSLVGFYFLNVAFIAWCCGRRAGLVASFFGALLWWWIDQFGAPRYPSPLFGIWNASMRVLLFSVGSIACAELRKALDEKQQIITELREALNQVKTLSGILPTCPCCHRVRVEKGSWEKLETYVRLKSKIEFVSSICPDCVEQEFVEEKGKG